MTDAQHEMLDELTKRIDELPTPEYQNFVKGLSVYTREMMLSGKQAHYLTVIRASIT